MPGGGSKPAERRGGRQRGTPNKTLTERAQALAAKVAKAEARANAKLVVLARAIQATVAESRGLPGASARERFKELVLNALVAEKLALKEIAHEPENTSIAEPAAEPTAAPDDADGVLVDSVVVREEFKSAGDLFVTPNPLTLHTEKNLLSPFSNIRAITPKLCTRSRLAIVEDHWP